MKDKVKKALKRVASGLMASIFAVCLVGTPRVKAVAVVDDVAVGAMSCEAFLASIGLPLTATGGSSAVTAGVTAAAGEYAAATGAAASGEAFLGTVAAGTAISTAGAIVLTAAAAVALGAFAYWLYDTYLSDSDNASIYDSYQCTTSVNDYNFSYVDSSGIFHKGTFCNVPSFSVSFDDKNLRAFTSFKGTVNGSDTYYINVEKNGVVIRQTGAIDTSNHSLGLVYDVNDKEVYIGQFIKSQNICQKMCTFSTELIPNINHMILGLSDSDFRPIAEEELGPTKQMLIDVGAAPGTTLDDLAQTVPDAIANGQFAPTYVIQVAPSVDPPPVPVLPPEVDPTPEVDAPEDIAPYTVGLGEVFPFCIPFDIYHMVTMFAAEPEAPAATWEFTLPWSGQECEVSWSLEEWDEVAKLCRSLELVLFCVGLAAATYKMIKW